MRLSLVAVLALGGLVGCRGKIVATAELHGPGNAEMKLSVPKVVLWADTDAKWNGPKNSKPEFRYDIDVQQGGKSIGQLECSTGERSGTSVCGGHTNIMGSHSADCEIALKCEVPPHTGEITLKIKASQGPNVTSVTKMSLNARLP